jgi:hypothetical protein
MADDVDRLIVKHARLTSFDRESDLSRENGDGSVDNELLGASLVLYPVPAIVSYKVWYIKVVLMLLYKMHQIVWEGDLM